MTVSQKMFSRSPHYLEKNDLLEKLKQIGQQEVAEILKDKDIDGEKLIKLREIDVVSWRLSMPRKRILFSFIEKYKLNPSMLQIRSKPQLQVKTRNIPPRFQDKPPSVLPKINVVHPRVKQLPPVSEQKPQILYPRVQCKVQFPRKSPSPEPAKVVLKTFQKNNVAKVENEVEASMKLEPKINDDGYIKMTSPKPAIKLFTVNKRADQNSLSLSKEMISRSPSPSNSGQTALDMRGGSKNNPETIRTSPLRRLPKPPPIAPIKPLIKPIASTTFVPPKKKSANEVIDTENEYLEMDHDPFYETSPTDPNNSKHFFSSTNRSIKKPPLDLPLPVTPSTYVQNKDHKNVIPVGKPPSQILEAKPSIYANLSSDEIYESVSESNGGTRPNSYLEFEDVAAPTEPENSKDEPDTTVCYVNVQDIKTRIEQENKRNFSFSRFFNLRRTDKNLPSNDNSKLKYNLDYRTRPLPELPGSQPSTTSIPVTRDSGGKISVTAEFPTEEKKEDASSPPEQAKNAKTHVLENSSKGKDTITKKEAVLVSNRSCLAQQLREKLAQLKFKSSTPTTPTEDSSGDDTDEFDESNPEHAHEEDNTNFRKQNAYSYELAILKRKDTNISQNVSSDKALDDEIEDELEEELYVEPASKITKDPFYRNATKNEAKQYLENLEDGAFIFIPSTSGNCFLVLTIKYAKKFYYMRLKKNRNNMFRLVGEDENCYPEFSTLAEFVEYFTKEPITIHSDGTFIDILLKPVLPKKRFLKN